MIHKVHLKYFGQIAEFTGKSSEIITVETTIVKEILDLLNQSYPGLSAQEFNVAVDHEIVDTQHQVIKDIEIALLPPFAGG
jgi:molybdopterin synthase sulfur carrier subunit